MNYKQSQVSLSTAAKEIINRQDRNKDLLFGLSAESVSTLFRRARDKAGVEGVTFHDTRHTALTRLAKIYQVMDLAKVSGHRDLRQLLNVYYNPSIDDLADKLD